MAKKEKPPTIVMTDGKREIIRQLFSRKVLFGSAEKFL